MIKSFTKARITNAFSYLQGSLLPSRCLREVLKVLKGSFLASKIDSFLGDRVGGLPCISDRVSCQIESQINICMIKLVTKKSGNMSETLTLIAMSVTHVR